MAVIFAIQGLAAAIGLLAAYFWWKSAKLAWKTVTSLDDAKGDDGDLAFDFGGEGAQIWQIARQNRLNANAAILTAISVVLQVIAATGQIF